MSNLKNSDEEMKSLENKSCDLNESDESDVSKNFDDNSNSNLYEGGSKEESKKE